MSRYAVTGCAGFVGSHLTEALLAKARFKLTKVVPTESVVSIIEATKA